MSNSTLLDFLAERIATMLRSDAATVAPLSSAGTRSGSTRTRTPDDQARKIAEELILEAVQSGLPLLRFDIDREPLSGGNTAEVVEKLVLRAPFVLKLDTKTKKLAEEALAMRAIKNNRKLTERYRAAWPTIYAIRQEAPFAYIMEMFPKVDGWASLEDMLFPRDPASALTVQDALTTGDAVLDLMFEGFDGSVDVRSTPSLVADYINRIDERLQEAAKIDSRFASRPLLVHGIQLRPWSEYLETIHSAGDTVRRIAPPFRTVVHGDPNPGNIMLRRNGDSFDIKFIDPKEWIVGDYLFDVAKLTHFLQATGPVEKSATPGKVGVSYLEHGGTAMLSYQYRSADWTEPLVRACRTRAQKFAADHGDAQWEARYELAMASNLLGLPSGRLTHRANPRPESALILYAEGLKWLDRFCARLSPAKSAYLTTSHFAEEADIEPAPLKQFRERVAELAPEVTRNTDRRGFNLLHWQPVRPNDQNKPQELSLEHEIRLSPLSESGLEQLLLNLHASIGRAVCERVAPGSLKFGDLTIQRYPRDAGPQSVDHYYDVKGASARLQLIPKMFTLRRRVKTSSFMTWSGSAAPVDVTQQSPLNLELPFVALGNKGTIARLEFNWIDNLETALAEVDDATLSPKMYNNNPICLVKAINGSSFAGVTPVIEHTTFREKFAFADAGGEKRFALNIDRITAQSLGDGRMGSYVDIDISSYRPIDATELAGLMAFGAEIAQVYGFGPNLVTKAFRDASAVGLLDA